MAHSARVPLPWSGGLLGFLRPASRHLRVALAAAGRGPSAESGECARTGALTVATPQGTASEESSVFLPSFLLLSVAFFLLFPSIFLPRKCGSSTSVSRTDKGVDLKNYRALTGRRRAAAKQPHKKKLNTKTRMLEANPLKKNPREGSTGQKRPRNEGPSARVKTRPRFLDEPSWRGRSSRARWISARNAYGRDFAPWLRGLRFSRSELRPIDPAVGVGSAAAPRRRPSQKPDEDLPSSRRLTERQL